MAEDCSLYAVTVLNIIRLKWLKNATYTQWLYQTVWDRTGSRQQPVCCDCTKEYNVELAEDCSLYAVTVPNSIGWNWLKTTDSRLCLYQIVSGWIGWELQPTNSDCTKYYKDELALESSLYAVTVPNSIRYNWLKTTACRLWVYQTV